ncbi:MAG: hypothetical protein EOM70_04250 [Clostridia bacterium]|nr:hypothetical protein [Clostridia bacterium]
MEKNKGQLVLDVIARKNTSYLPSVINFANLAKKMECARHVGIDNEDDFDRYLGNHIKFTVQLDDVASHDWTDPYKLEVALASGRTRLNTETGRLIDPWGLQFNPNATSYFNYGHPLAGIEENPGILETYQSPSLIDMDLLFGVAVEDLKKYGDEYLMYVSGYNGIWEKAYDLVGIEEFMYLLATETATAEKLMDLITDYKVEIARETIRRGFKIGHHGDDLGTQISTLISEEMFVTLLKPRIKRIFDVYKSSGIPVQMHSCGYITPFIPHLIEIGLDVLEPVQPCMDISFLKREYGKDLTFYGGIDTQDLLAFRSPQEIRTETLRTIDILGSGGGYICAPAQEIMDNVPPENVAAVVAALREARDNRF